MLTQEKKAAIKAAMAEMDAKEKARKAAMPKRVARSYGTPVYKEIRVPMSCDGALNPARHDGFEYRRVFSHYA